MLVEIDGIRHNRIINVIVYVLDTACTLTVGLAVLDLVRDPLHGWPDVQTVPGPVNWLQEELEFPVVEGVRLYRSLARPIIRVRQEFH